ncbi:phosphoketolase family protein [Candidatus Peregrinibacteria bacterium]|nr:MAG: phosphoketolase family protein [Candidatus Peregrinibacteria bacterium]
MTPTDQKALQWLSKYLRYVDYIGAAQLYLKDNILLEQKLEPEHIKERILGHWGTVPGLNFIYAHLNYLVWKHACEMLIITGPGHGAPAILANLFAEKTMGEFYKDYPRNAQGMAKLIHDFSWPHTLFPSHVTPGVPGSILEGGELGYSLATAFGAVMDNPNLIAVAIVGDGEAETGPIAAAWHSNKFLNPSTSGAVLPIVHINGYKISNPTLFGRMDDAELRALFTGYGYEPMIVEAPNLEKKMMEVMEKAYQNIRAIQKKARASKKPYLKPKWPVILLRSPKGWKGIAKFQGHSVEGSFRAHGVPVDHPKKDPIARKAIESWLKLYKIHELVDAKGQPKPEVVEFLPTGSKRIGMCKHAIGGNMMKPLKLPSLSKYAVRVNKRGHLQMGSTPVGGQFLRDVIKLNPKTFRIFCPDELQSNLIKAPFEVTGREFLWPLNKNDEHMKYGGRILEVLSEHSLQGWMMGYTLTGRYGFFSSYEAFLTIIASMVDQYAKFLKQSFKIHWRRPVPPLVYHLGSVGWRQEHNGYSHQNPSFVSNVLQKHGEFCQVYYPADANSFLVALEEAYQRPNTISVIVADKREVPQWLTLEEAREQAKKGIAIWEWVGGKEGSKNPDVVLASAGDYMTQEALHAVKLCRELVPEMKVRYVNISELTGLCMGDYCSRAHSHAALSRTEVEKYFTPDRPVVINYHGYTNDMEQILWPFVDPQRFSLHGYQERGSTTTPFDLKVVNETDFYHLAMDMITRAAQRNKAVAKKKDKLIAMLKQKIVDHQKYITETGDDPEEVKVLRW